MPDTHDGKLESVRLNQEAARRLIQRATELDASLATESSVAELREAARGAGISDEAFQRALDEVRNAPIASPIPVAPGGTYARRKVLAIAAIVLIVGGLLLAVMTVIIPAGVRRPVDYEPAARPPAIEEISLPPPTPPSPKKTTKVPPTEKKP